jgi:flagellar basal-body rod modification protein FlgD
MFVEPTSIPAQTTTETGTDGTSMGKEQFLQLFIAQLDYQDPLNPLENEEFVAQMAQFSSLEQQMLQNDNLNMILMSQMSQSRASTISFIGKSVLAVGDWMDHEANVPDTLKFHLDGEAESVELKIYDSDGKVVRTMDLEDTQAGDNEIQWDGLDDDGNPMASGDYTFEISALDADEAPIEVMTYITGIVDGVDFSGESPQLQIGDRTLLLADVIRVEGEDDLSNSLISPSIPDSLVDSVFQANPRLYATEEFLK